MADTNDALADELSDYLAGDPHFAPTEDGQQLAPLADEAEVDRMLRRRRRLISEKDRVAAVAQAEIARIRDWQEDRTAGIEAQMVWLDRGLEMYMRGQHEATGRKSLPLPSGTLKLTQPGAPSVLVVDEGEFVTWALSDDERDKFLHRTVRAEKQELRAGLQMGPEDDGRDDGVPERWWFAVDGDGEVVPGLRFVKPAQARFSVAHPKADTVTGPEHDEQDTRTEEMD